METKNPRRIVALFVFDVAIDHCAVLIVIVVVLPGMADDGAVRISIAAKERAVLNDQALMWH
jgi:hypothetical protein